MQTSKIKNVFILALVLVNIFLLVLVIPQERETENSYNETGRRLERLYAGRGISLDWQTVPKGLDLYELELDSGEQFQLAAAQVLKNAAAVEGDSMVSNLYRGELGEAEFHKSGAFTVTFTGLESAGANLEKAAEETLTKMGFEISGVLETERVSAGRYTVSAVQKLENVPVYSASAVLQYDNNSLTSVSGVWYTNYEGRKGNKVCISAATALVSFLSSQNKLGWLCTSVESVTQGYVEEETPSLGAASLVPVWKIETDTGAFYVNGLSKEVTAT